jgi:hypothetical protein
MAIINFLFIGFVSTLRSAVDPETDPGNEQKSNSIKQRDNLKDIILCLNEIITEIVDREIIDKCLNELIDIVSTIDELVENITSIDILQKEDLISEQDSTSHFENSVDIDTKESISSETELDEENSQKNIPTDKLMPVTNIHHGIIEHFDPENIQKSIHEDKLRILANMDDRATEHR